MALFSRSKNSDASTEEATEPKDSKDRREPKARKPRTPIRTQIARVVWLLFVLAALFLAVGALLVAIGANRDNALVRFVLDTADSIDLGIFSRRNGVMHFTGHSAQTKNALVNWGLGAVAYLIVGRIL